MKMLQYTVKRFVIMLFTLFIIATATFFLLAATPGDALSARVEKLPDSVAARMYAKYGLDKPVMERYVITMKGLVHGDFGESIIYEGQTVQSIIKEKAPISARLGIQQMLLGVSLGLALGVLAAVKKGSFWDYLVVALSILLISVPNLVFALLLQQVFAGKLGWFPVIGWPSDHLWTSGWNYTVLPTLAGCFGYIASYARLLKASMLQDLEKGKPCEIEAINGVVSSYGKKVNVPTPFNDKVIEIIRSIERGERKPSFDNLPLFDSLI